MKTTYSGKLAATALSSLLLCQSLTLAGNNRADVLKEHDARYERFYPGDEFKTVDVLVGGKAELIVYAAKAAKWLATVGVQITAETLIDLIVNGKSVGDVSGGIAAIQHWSEHQVPYLVREGWEIKTKWRIVRVPEPNTFIPFVGHRRK